MATEEELELEREEAEAELELERAESANELACGVEGCDYVASSKLLLGAHRANKHGIRAVKKAPSGRGPGRPKGSRNRSAAPPSSETGRQERRRKAVRETLLELTTFTDELRGRGEGNPDDLADVIRRDADKLASSIAWIAERFTPMGRVIDLTLGHGGVVTVGRGFMGVGTWVLSHWRNLITQREQVGQELTAEQMAEAMAEQYADAQERAYLG